MIITDSMENLGVKAAEIIKENLIKLANEKESILFGLVGGESIKSVLLNLKKEKEIPWDKIFIFIIDERFVSYKSKESNSRLIFDELVDDLIKNKTMPEKAVEVAVKSIDKEEKGWDRYVGFVPNNLMRLKPDPQNIANMKFRD